MLKLAIDADKQVINANKEPTTGVPQQRRWKATRDNCIRQLLLELTNYMPKEVILSPQAEHGVDYLTTKKQRTIDKKV